MLFLFYFVTTCFAVPVEKLHQVLDNKDASIVGKDLLTKLKSSNGEFSKSLITSLVDADPDAVKHVKSLVEALIAAGEGERDKYTGDRDTKKGTFDHAEAILEADTLAHTAAAGELSGARDEVQRLTGLKAAGKTAQDEAQNAYDDAVSKFNEAAANLEDETERVDTEKATLEEIRRLLNTLLPAEEAEETDGWINLGAADLEKAVCDRVSGNGAIAVVSADHIDFTNYPDWAGNPAVIYCDIETNFKFNQVRGQFDIVPVSSHHPDDNYASTFWGEQTKDHLGYIAFGTPSNIVLPGGLKGKDVRERSTYEIPATTVALSNTIRFGSCQSYNMEDFRLDQFNIQVYPVQG